MNKFESFGSQMEWAYPDMDMPRNITFQISDQCNMRCSYCYEINKGNHVMDLSTGKRFVDMLLSDKSVQEYLGADNISGIILDFIGGEPLLHTNLIDAIVDYYIEQTFRHPELPWRHNFRISMSTNGLNYFDYDVQRFIEKHKSHLSISITLDGNESLHDSCRRTIDGQPTYQQVLAACMDYMKRFGGKATKLTIAPQNVMYVNDALQNMVSLGYTNLHANCVFEDVWAKKDAKILYYQIKGFADYLLENNLEDKIRCSLLDENLFIPDDPRDDKNHCGGTGCMLAVDWKGNLYPCFRYSPCSLPSTVSPLVIGDVNRGIGVTEQERNVISELKAITRTSQSSAECISCPIARGCGWCSANNYALFGTANKRAMTICDMHKARSVANAYYWNKYYRKHGIDKRFKVNCPQRWMKDVLGKDEFHFIKFLEKRSD